VARAPAQPETAVLEGRLVPPGRERGLRATARRNPLLVVGAVLCLAIAVTAVFAPLIAPFPADAGDATHPLETLEAPSSTHPFGTDQVGRDVFSRVLYGARISPLIALLVLAISCVIGIPLGIAAG
jgi:peptide/nickel transport system permease protein